jgi:flagellar hook-basal body complex protein FliE
MGPIAPIDAAFRPIEPAGIAAPSGSGFAKALGEALASATEAQRAADGAAEAFATGHTGDVAATMLTVEQASLSLQFLLQIRNRLLEAYQEIQRLAV